MGSLTEWIFSNIMQKYLQGRNAQTNSTDFGR